jgi:hypothetical protein
VQETASSVYDEEIAFVEAFLGRIRALPADSKLKRLIDDLAEILRQRETVLVFTRA